MQIRRATERGHANHGWLDSYHTFSFADYYDPNHMGFRTLRVVNEDRVQPGQGFGTHPHRDMEILTYVLEGSLAHKDSMGNGSVIRPGDAQRMSAGTGITHSEFNASDSNLVHFLQIWILPDRQSSPPSYEQRSFDLEAASGNWLLLASSDGQKGSISIHQDVRVMVGRIGESESLDFTLQTGRHVFVHVVRGSVRAGGHRLDAGDALMSSGEPAVRFEGVDKAEILLFDLA
jgi:quercetin 2,3-dioxygenase